MKERVHWIDLSKGIAIILVVIGHVVSSYHEAGLYQDNHLFNFSHQFAYSFHMALFMILSGYLASKGKKRGTRSQQALQKLINYGIPYVIFSVIWVSMKLLMAGHTNSAVSVKDLLFIPVYPISFMWFIYALIFMQVIQVFVNPKSIVGKGIHLLVAWGGVLHTTIFSEITYRNKVFGLRDKRFYEELHFLFGRSLLCRICS